MNVKQLMEKAVEFHGHACPGLALGILVSKYILEHGFNPAIDEELVAIVENNNCSVDALQTLLKTTFGKGNLIYKDFGKNNYTIYSRKLKKGIRLSLKGHAFREEGLSREERLEKILNANPEDIFNIQEVEFNPPEMAKIEKSYPCDVCKELTMESRLTNHEGKRLCKECLKKITN